MLYCLQHARVVDLRLARWTTMPVAEACDGVAVAANRVLVIPGGTVAGLRDGHLSLHHLAPDAPRNLAPIDTFFDSLATSLMENAIGVSLSGTGHDGELGLKAIRARSGLALAQGGNGMGSEYSGIPDSAIAVGVVDLLVPVEDMPDHILAVRQARLAMRLEADQIVSDRSKIRLAICDVPRSHRDHNFSQYKHQTFMRRVQRRMQMLWLTNYARLLRLLKNWPRTGHAAVPRPGDQRYQLLPRHFGVHNIGKTLLLGCSKAKTRLEPVMNLA